MVADSSSVSPDRNPDREAAPEDEFAVFATPFTFDPKRVTAPSPSPLSAEAPPTAPATPTTVDSRFAGGSGYYASCDVTPERPEGLPDLEKLLDDLQMRSLEAAARIMGRDEVYNEAQMQVRAARSALIKYVRELEERISSLRLGLAETEIGERDAEAMVENLTAKVHRLSAASLTADEAQAILDQPVSLAPELIYRLRCISSTGGSTREEK